MIDIDLIYKEYKKDFKLPPFAKLNHEIELSTVEPSEFFLRAIRRRFVEKIMFFSKVIENMIYPGNGSLANMHESKFFTEKEKQQLADIYKKLIIFERKSIELDIDPNENQEAALISELYKELPNIKSNLSQAIKTVKDGWLKNNKKFKESLYFG